MAVELEPGENLLCYRSRVDGSAQPYRLYLPRRLATRFPVLICLHGYGGRMSQPSEVAQRWADALGWLLLSPDGRGNQHWDGLGEDDVFDALGDLGRRLWLDPERIYLFGGSMGGHGALRLALRYPHRFAGVYAVAGWISAAQFYRRWYAAPGEWSPPEPIRHLVDAAAPWTWRRHARWIDGCLAYGDADPINDPADAEWLVAWLAERGLLGRRRWRAHRVPGGGHGAGMSWPRVFQFLWPKRRRWPRELVSPMLRCADSGWCVAQRLEDPHRPARLRFDWRPGAATVECANVAELTLRPAAGPPALRRGRVTIQVAGEGRTEQVVIPAGEEVTLSLSAAPGPYRKRRGTSGPIGELFRERFEVIAPPAGPDLEAAERFCADWNAWFVCRWSEGEPPAGRPWWRYPYAWPPGAHVAREQPSILPRTAETADETAHLVLFGRPQDNPLVHRFAAWPGPLPFRPHDDGITIGDRSYSGERIGWLALHPAPWRPDRLVLLCSGYLHSGIDPSTGLGWLGKDLESLPWQYPDLVIWDRTARLRETVQPPLRHLPDAWLLAVSFGPAWTLAGARIWRR